MTLLTIVQDAASEIGLPRPSVVVGNNDVNVLRLLRYAKREGKEILKRGDWQNLRAESTFTSLAQETQTAMVASDLDHFVNETFWNRTRKRPLFGPKTPQEWQTIKGAVSSVAVDTFTYRGTAILINPVPAAGQTFAYEYISNKYCQSSGGTAQAVWTADTDTARLPEELFTLGVIWRFKKGRGQPFEAEFQEYNFQIGVALMHDQPRIALNMAGEGRGWGPGIGVPEGSWNL